MHTFRTSESAIPNRLSEVENYCTGLCLTLRLRRQVVNATSGRRLRADVGGTMRVYWVGGSTEGLGRA